LARTYRHLGILFHETDQAENARDAFRRAFDLLEELVAQDASQPGFRADLAHCQVDWGNLLVSFKQFPDAEKAYGKAIELWKELAAKEQRQQAYYQLHLAMAQNNLGVLLQKPDPPRYAEARDAFQK